VGDHVISAIYSGDSNFNPSVSAPLNRIVYPDTLYIITDSPLDDVDAKMSYLRMLRVINGVPPYKWAVKKGTKLAPGLTLKLNKLDSSKPAISGKPRQAGNYSFIIQVTDKVKNVFEKNFALFVNPADVFIYPALPKGEVGTVFPAWKPTASGGNETYTWSITKGGLPAGLNLDSATGAINGTPQANGPFRFTLTVADTLGGSSSKSLSLIVYKAVSITTPSLSNGKVGVRYSQTLRATGGSGKKTWSLVDGTLPGGLSLNPSTGAITGKPASAGSYPFTVKLTDGIGGETTKDFAISVSE